MREDAGDDEEVAGFAVGVLTFALDADAAAILDAGGDFDVDGFELAVAGDLQGQSHAAGGLGEGEGDGIFDVFAARGRGAGSGAAACARCAASAAALLAEELFEDVGEAGVTSGAFGFFDG